MLTIGALAEATGVKVPTIRYYEEVGLLPEPSRSRGNQRRYGREALERLTFVRQARELGFPLDAIRELLSLADRPEQPCDAADAIVRRQLRAVDARLTRLEALKTELERMLAECAGGRIETCRVIEVLSDHDRCRLAHQGAAPRTGGAPA